MTTPPRDSNEPEPSTGEAAMYLAEMCASLATIARRYRLDALGYILDMAQEEARTNAAPLDGGGKGR